MTDIPDFLEMPDVFVSDKPLRRTDLADLRHHIRHPEGLKSSSCLSHASRKRLIEHDMIEYRDGLAHATDYGIEVARANASCIDGSEGLRTSSGRDRDIAAELDANIEHIQAADHVISGGVFMPRRPASRADYGRVLILAMSEILAPPAPDVSPLATIREAHAARMGVGAAVVAWVRRRWCYARLALMIGVSDKNSGGRS
jgi:hypothetical protein